jgi:hypothetical protein
VATVAPVVQAGRLQVASEKSLHGRRGSFTVTATIAGLAEKATIALAA